jgi:hypothetical protein
VPDYFSLKGEGGWEMSFTSQKLTRSTIQPSYKQPVHKFPMDLSGEILVHEMSDRRLQ